MKNRTIAFTGVIVVMTFLLSIYCQPVHAAGEIQIVSHSSFCNSINVFYVVGELENTGTVATEFTKVNATFYDTENQVIASSIGYSTLDVLLPGRKSPFAVLLTEDNGALDVHNYTLSVSWTEYTEDMPLGLEILSSSDYIDALDYMHVTGEIKNTAATEATSVLVGVTFYDSNGTVIDRNWEYADPSDLAANQTATFDVELIYADVSNVASYSITAESENYALIPEFPTMTPLLVALAVALVAAVIYKKKLTKL